VTLSVVCRAAVARVVLLGTPGKGGAGRSHSRLYQWTASAHHPRSDEAAPTLPAAAGSRLLLNSIELRDCPS
jgi:hypothetical protein